MGSAATTVPTEAELLRVLQNNFGLTAFRGSQLEAVKATLEGYDSIVILPTGAGKVGVDCYRDRQPCPPSMHCVGALVDAVLDLSVAATHKGGSLHSSHRAAGGVDEGSGTGRCEAWGHILGMQEGPACVMPTSTHMSCIWYQQVEKCMDRGIEAVAYNSECQEAVKARVIADLVSGWMTSQTGSCF
jgi:hypothetical protein